MADLIASVIVPVFNRQALIGQAVQSLLEQTMQAIEIIVVDDGSSDRTAETAEVTGGSRVRVIRHSTNRGIAAARNTGLQAARGRYIAWLDSDDLARPRRLERQVNFLDDHPEVALVGSAAGRIASDGRRKFGARVPFQSHETLSPSLLFRSPFQQSSVTGRAAVLKEFEYRQEFPVCEDFDMFIRLSRKHRVANLPEVLIDRRIHAGQIGRMRSAQVRDHKKLLIRDMLGQLGIDPSDQDLERHIDLGTPHKTPLSPASIAWSRGWLSDLAAANARNERYDQRGLATVCGRIWTTSCFQAMKGRHFVPIAGALLSSSLTLGLFNADGIEWCATVISGLLN